MWFWENRNRLILNQNNTFNIKLNDRWMGNNDLTVNLSTFVNQGNNYYVSYFFATHKTKPKYDFIEYQYVPILDPLINPGTIMKSYGAGKRPSFFIVEETDGKRIWKDYDSFEDVGINYLTIDILYDIYGDIITVINKKDIRITNYCT